MFEGLDGLWSSVFQDLELVAREIVHRLAVSRRVDVQTHLTSSGLGGRLVLRCEQRRGRDREQQNKCSSNHREPRGQAGPGSVLQPPRYGMTLNAVTCFESPCATSTA